MLLLLPATQVLFWAWLALTALSTPGLVRVGWLLLLGAVLLFVRRSYLLLSKRAVRQPVLASVSYRWIRKLFVLDLILVASTMLWFIATDSAVAVMLLLLAAALWVELAVAFDRSRAQAVAAHSGNA